MIEWAIFGSLALLAVVIGSRWVRHQPSVFGAAIFAVMLAWLVTVALSLASSP